MKDPRTLLTTLLNKLLRDTSSIALEAARGSRDGWEHAERVKWSVKEGHKERGRRFDEIVDGSKPCAWLDDGQNN